MDRKIIYIKDEYTEYEKIFELLKNGYELSLMTIKNFDDKEEYVLFANKANKNEQE